jgi:uroporphyrinogen-III synthase
MPFSGLRVLSLESRRAKEIEALIRKQGGDPFVAPSVQEKAVQEQSAAFTFARRLSAGEFDLVICMTGSGLNLLAELVAPEFSQAELAEAFARVTTLSRGPKPAAVLRAWGVPVGVKTPEPNTWREIVRVLAPRPEQRVAVLEYGRPNLRMNEALEAQRRVVSSFPIYRWNLPEDTSRLREAVHRIVARECQVVLFTSSIQLEHLILIATEMDLDRALLEALRGPVVTASIGPLMTETMRTFGLQPDIVPAHPKMAALVKAAADQAGPLLLAKRQS